MSDAFWGAAIPGIVAITLAMVGVYKTLIEIGKVHTIVNSQKTKMQKEINGLRRLITQSITQNVAVKSKDAAQIKPAPNGQRKKK